MSIEFNPVNTWLRYGISDLYFGYVNQSNDVFKYGTFFLIMAAEKHLKAVLIENHKDEYQDLTELSEKQRAVDVIAKRYSHNFKKMISDVSEIYHRKTGGKFVSGEVYGYGYDCDHVIQSMFEGYMETRYPVVTPTARQYPFPYSDGSYHDPLGSSFFIDFIIEICQKCWDLLIRTDINPQAILSIIEDQYINSRKYSLFKTEHLSKLQVKL